MPNPIITQRTLLSTGPTQFYDPFNVSGLMLWLPNGDWNLSGSSANQWNDRSGNGYHATQSTGANQPTRINGAVNGLPVLRGDGTDFMSFTGSGLSMFNGLAATTIIIVAKWTGSASNLTAFYFADNTGATSSRIQISRTATVERLVVRNVDGGTASVTATGSYTAGNYYILTYVLDPNNGSGTYTGYQNGTSVISGSPSSAGAFPNTAANVARLFNNGNGSAAMSGDLGLVLAYNKALNTQERQYLERGIGQQFGLTVA